MTSNQVKSQEIPKPLDHPTSLVDSQSTKDGAKVTTPTDPGVSCRNTEDPTSTKPAATVTESHTGSTLESKTEDDTTVQAVSETPTTKQLTTAPPLQSNVEVDTTPSSSLLGVASFETNSASGLNPYSPASPNPWNDGNPPTTEERPVTLPDPASLGQCDFKSESPTPPPNAPPAKDILSEFDPLSIQEEKAAKDAWESSESHPPPPRTPSPPPPTLPDKDNTPTPTTSKSPSTSSDFPSFASLARTFALPLTPLAKPRPQSIDIARPVASPATLSSFASHQQAPQRQPDASTSRSSTPIVAGSGTASPVQSSRSDKPSDGQFDFQTFLDQMKSKSAEPVSKYLRS